MQAALDAGHVTQLGVGVIVAVVVVGFILAVVISKIIGKIIVIGLVVLAAVVVWSQRTSIEHKIDQRKCDLTFFGVHLDPPKQLTNCDRGASGRSG